MRWSLLCHLFSPAYAIVRHLEQRRLYENKTLPLPFSIRVQKFIEEAGLVRGDVKPYFSYIMLDIKTPTWSIELPNINTELAEFLKKSTPEGFYRHEFQRLMEEYIDYRHIFTNWSKTEAGVGAAVVSGDIIERANLPYRALIYSAEVQAIVLAVQLIRRRSEDLWYFPILIVHCVSWEALIITILCCGKSNMIFTS